MLANVWCNLEYKVKHIQPMCCSKMINASVLQKKTLILFKSLLIFLNDSA